jgi:hypothetical protein
MTEDLRDLLRRQLVRPSQVARQLGVGRAAFSNWKRRYPDFPEPVIDDVYWKPDIDKFLDRHDLPGHHKANDGRMIRRYGWPGFSEDQWTSS